MLLRRPQTVFAGESLAPVRRRRIGLSVLASVVAFDRRTIIISFNGQE